jgi:hypothetical protein
MPASLAITQVGDSHATTAGTTRTLNNTSAAGGVVHKAGQPFSLRAAARDSSGATTAGYTGNPPVLIAACTLPATGCVTGSLSTGTLTAANGPRSADTLTYNEVLCAIRITIIDDTFTAIDSATRRWRRARSTARRSMSAAPCRITTA